MKKEVEERLSALRVIAEEAERKALACHDMMYNRTSMLRNFPRDVHTELTARDFQFYLHGVARALEDTVPEERLIPLLRLRDAFRDLQFGIVSPIFKPPEGAREKLPYEYGWLMGLGALAVKLAGRSHRAAVLQKAARKLMVREKTLSAFAKNISASDGRIKSTAANEAFRDLGKALNNPDDVETILENLEPVPKEYRDDDRYKNR